MGRTGWLAKDDILRICFFNRRHILFTILHWVSESTPANLHINFLIIFLVFYKFPMVAQESEGDDDSTLRSVLVTPTPTQTTIFSTKRS
jgi:hypothetical protein